MIADRSSFTKNVFARDKAGRSTNAIASDATKFCARVALMRTAFNRKIFNYWSTEYLISKELAGSAEALAYVNNGPDGRRKVLKLFDKALAE